MVAFVGKTNTDEDNGLKLILCSYNTRNSISADNSRTTISTLVVLFFHTASVLFSLDFAG